MQRKRIDVFSLTQIAICTAVLCVSAFLIIPLPIVPITLQLFAVVLVALLLKPSHTLTCVSLYILLGCIGLPVFSGGKGGIGVLFSPTGGFIFGFLVGAFLISLFKGKDNKMLRYIFVSIICGIIPIYILGTGFFMIFTNSDLLGAITSVCSVFIIIDIIKSIIASVLAVTINKALVHSKLF